MDANYITIIDEYVLGIACQDFEFYIKTMKKRIPLNRLMRKLGLGRFVRKGVRRGQVLGALSLMAWTEYMGGLLPDAPKGDGQKFNEFFRKLGPKYEEFANQHNNVYWRFRCGLVHDLFIRQNCVIAVPDSDDPLIIPGPPDVEIERPRDVGIGYIWDNDHYFIILETYFKHFKQAAIDLRDHYLEHGITEAQTRQVFYPWST
jgi:hypothetical protein